MQFSIRHKLLLGFSVVCAIIVVTGGLSFVQVGRLYQSSIQMEGDFLVDDAIMEVTNLAIRAHLGLEEILSGAQDDDINDVWNMIVLAQKYCEVIYEGGEMHGRWYMQSANPGIRDHAAEIKEHLAKFLKLAKKRYKQHKFSAKAGSEDDQIFDQLYEAIKVKMDLLVHSDPALAVQLNELKFQMADAHIFLEEFLVGDQSVVGDDVIKKFKSVGALLSSLAKSTKSPQISALVTDFEKLGDRAGKRIAVRKSSVVAGSEMHAGFAEIFHQTDEAVEKIHNLIMRDLDESMITVKTTHGRIRMFIMTASLLSFLVSLLIGLFLARNLSVPISRLIVGLRRMAEGDLSAEVEVSRGDEIGDISLSFNEVLLSMREAAQLADQVSQGDYGVSIVPKSEQDQLGQALGNMTTQLGRMKQANADQLWLAETHAGLVKIIRGELDLLEIGKNTSSYLAEKLDAQIVSFYIADEGGDLQLRGSYAFNLRKGVSDTIKVGQGLVGQAAVEKELISVTDIPADYIRINSSLGDCLPRNIVVVPFIHEDSVKGVIELGCCEEFSPIQLQLLKNVIESIAIAVNGAEVHAKINQLLAESQSQTEELQVQQEELQAANEELEEKTNELIKSEIQLQAQQEELEVTNVELEGRSGLLEKQKNELEKQRNEIAKKARELELTSKYKSEFLANMSHELRTPLNSILILSQLLSHNKDKNLTKKQRDFAKTINTSGNDLLELINEVLDLSKVEAGKMKLVPEEINLKDFMDEISQAFSPVAEEKDLSFTIDIAKTAPKEIITDQQRLRQIVKNLIGNGIKFTEQGSVAVKIVKPRKNVDLSISGLNPASAVAVIVKDTGTGIADDQQQLIFEAFQQEDGTSSRKYGGTGLGLSIAREMAFFLGGEIQLQSEVGKGSTFTLYLPLEVEASPMPEIDEGIEIIKSQNKITPGRGEAHEDSAPPSGEMDDDRGRIGPEDRSLLIVEDDQTFAELIVDLGRQRGFKCIAAGDGESGLRCAEYYQPSAIVLDIGLPRMDGWEVMDRLKENSRTRHIPVHFITATDQSQEGMLRGAIGFLTKPASEESLQSALQRIDEVISSEIKHLLVVEDDLTQRNSIAELIGNGDVVISAVESGSEALEMLKSQAFDCMILDLGLKDISGFELLEKIRDDEKNSRMPVIIYTGRELTKEQEVKLAGFAESIIVKGARSPERLLAETTLFLHRVESRLPEEKRRMLTSVHDHEAVLSGRKVLIVDDDMRNVFALSSFLQEKGLKTLIGKNGKEALATLEAHPDTELVIMDIMMPEMDGYEAMEKIRAQKRFKDLPIIALTAKAMKGDRNKCIEAGANDYLAKPVDIEQLFSLLRIWLYQ